MKEEIERRKKKEEENQEENEERRDRKKKEEEKEEENGKDDTQKTKMMDSNFNKLITQTQHCIHFQKFEIINFLLFFFCKIFGEEEKDRIWMKGLGT